MTAREVEKNTQAMFKSTSVVLKASTDGLVVVEATDPHTSWAYRWDEVLPGAVKVVPADAIVIERGDLPQVRPSSEVTNSGSPMRSVDLVVVDGSFTELVPADRTRVPGYADLLRERARRDLALAEYLTAHPQIDEAQVEALTPLVADAFDTAGGCPDGWSAGDLALALVMRGVHVGASK